MRVTILCAAVLSAVVLPRMSLGQSGLMAPASPKKAEPPTLQFTVHPSAEPIRALRYQFLPTLMDRKRGNAAVNYNKLAIQFETAFKDEEIEHIKAWNAVEQTPLDELPLAEVRAVLAKRERLLADLDAAARFNHCDWQFLNGQVNLYLLRLPELDNLREMSRLLGVRTRLAVAEGRYDDAVRSLQTGYAVGQHAADSNVLVAGLIGIACSGMMSSHVAELIQQSGAPNLYWALASLPDPLIDLRAGFEGEMYALHMSCPQLADVESTEHNEQYWRDAMKAIWAKMTQIGMPKELAFPGEAAVALMAARGYPMARQALIDQGRTPEEVDGMPVSQVIAIYTVRTYEELRDDLFKWIHVPYWQVNHDRDEMSMKLYRAGRTREIIPIAALVLPAVTAATVSEVRCDREIRMLRIVEAIRMHGRLPEKLAEITAVPIPLDPGAGKPFSYQLKGDTAILEAVVPADQVEWWGRRYEIKFAP